MRFVTSGARRGNPAGDIAGRGPSPREPHSRIIARLHSKIAQRIRRIYIVSRAAVTVCATRIRATAGRTRMDDVSDFVCPERGEGGGGDGEGLIGEFSRWFLSFYSPGLAFHFLLSWRSAPGSGDTRQILLTVQSKRSFAVPCRDVT